MTSATSPDDSDRAQPARLRCSWTSGRPWCGPCRVLGPVLEQLADKARRPLGARQGEHRGHARGSPRAYGVMSIPNVKLFKDGKVVDEFVGALPEREIRRWLDLLLPAAPAPVRWPRRASARRARRPGRRGRPRSRGVLADEPGQRARALRARPTLQLRTGPGRGRGDASRRSARSAEDRAEALRVLARWLAREGDAAEGAAREHVRDGAGGVRAGDWDAALAAVRRGAAGATQLRQRRGARPRARDLHPPGHRCTRSARSTTAASRAP